MRIKILGSIVAMVLIYIGCLSVDSFANSKATDKVIICSSLGKVETDNLIKEFTDKEDIKVEVAYLPAIPLAERLKLIAQKDYDVWLGGTAEEYYMAAREKMLVPYQYAESSIKDPEIGDLEGRWTPIYINNITLLVNKANLAKYRLSEIDKWEDLLEPVLFKETVLVKPEVSGATYGLITSTWQLLGQDTALDYARALRTQEPLYVENQGEAIAMVYNGEKTIAVLPSEIAFRTARKYTNLKVALPREINKNMVTGVALLRISKNRRNGEKFLEFLLGETGQNLLLDNQGRKSIYVSKNETGTAKECQTPIDDLAWMSEEKDTIIRAWFDGQKK